MNEHEFEPTPGLPQRLPPGEKMLWQGKPETLALAKRVFRISWIAGYFAILIIWRIAADIHDGFSVAAALSHASTLAVLMVCAVGFFYFMTWMMARATLYTITSKRVVMRVGAVFDVAVNLPFNGIVKADLVKRRDRTGDIVLSLEGIGHVSYWMLWPHVKPWNFLNVRPALRSLARPEEVAAILSHAVEAHGATRECTAPAPISVDRPDRQPVEAGLGGVAAAS